MLGKNKTPQDRIRTADKKIQKLRDKRENLDEFHPKYEDKKWKINNEIHKQNVEIKIAEKELKQPVNNTKNVTTNLNANFNYNKTENGVHLHGHIHNEKSKK